MHLFEYLLFCRRDDNLIEVPLDIMPKFDFTEITEMDVEKAFSFTSEIIALEIMNRIMITVFEVGRTIFKIIKRIVI